MKVKALMILTSSARAFSAMNRRMYSTRSISAESLTLPSDSNSNSNSNSESANGASGSETRVSPLRRKRLKQEVLDSSSSHKEMCGVLPDIEDLSYKKTNVSPRTSKLNSYVKSTEASTSASSSIRTAGKPPENWEKVLEGIRKMSSPEEATVDPVNCDRTGSFLPPKERRFYVLIGTLLSSQTKDHVTGDTSDLQRQ